MPDEMPPQSLRAEWNLSLGFLNLVFAKEGQPKPSGLRDDLGRLAFSHGHKSNFIRVAIGSATRGRNPLLN